MVSGFLIGEIFKSFFFEEVEKTIEINSENFLHFKALFSRKSFFK
jgi:hypothetical protein